MVSGYSAGGGRIQRGWWADTARVVGGYSAGGERVQRGWWADTARVVGGYSAGGGRIKQELDSSLRAPGHDCGSVTLAADNWLFRPRF